MTDALAQLSEQGVSIWLDDLSRDTITSGQLPELIDSRYVVGVTTNPTIFATALSKGDAYTDQMRRIADEGKDVDAAVFDITTADVQHACDIMRPLFDRTDGQDGRVSIEVEPQFAHDTARTVESARALAAAVDRPNAYIKIPATVEGLPAITQAIAEGISVNVTLIFSLERYRQVMDAYLAGLEQARDNGKSLGDIHSVASFFVSRVDTEIDKRLEAIGSDEALALRGKAAVANARLAYRAYEEKFASERFAALKADGANTQRPLWASTGVKNPDYDDTLYVSELVVSNTVNTMPEKTLEAYADHGTLDGGDTVRPHYDDARAVMDALAEVGIDYDDVIATLEQEGVDKFVKSWDELVETVRGQMGAQ
jgi:transaldolase